ncbi:MAG: hypothetical protein LBS90_04650 [Oscillospiraceae bacterium]|nr:hypothetical protein [Oscillospiraceae bacterium]
MNRIKRILAGLLAAAAVFALLPVRTVSAAAKKPKITIGDPVVRDKDGVAVQSANLGFAPFGDAFGTSYELDADHPDEAPTGYNLSQNYITWNKLGYEFLGWSVAGGKPELGLFEVGSGISYSKDYPVAKLLSPADPSKDWSFTFFVSERLSPWMFWNNVKFADGFEFAPVFRIVDGYDPTVPLADAGVETREPIRRGVKPLTAASFQDAKLVEIKEVGGAANYGGTYGVDIYDDYWVQVPADKTEFSFDVPIPEQGADQVKVSYRVGTAGNSGELKQEIVGDKLRITVDYSDPDAFYYIGNGTQRTAGGYEFWTAGAVTVQANYPVKDTTGRMLDAYHTVYAVRFFRMSDAGYFDNQFYINIAAKNREFAEIAKNYNGFSYGQWAATHYYRLMFNKPVSYEVYRYWTEGVYRAKIEKFVVNGIDVPVPDTPPDEEILYTVPGMGGGTVAIGGGKFARDDSLALRFNNLYAERDLDIEVVFEKLEPNYTVTAGNSGDKGKIVETYFDRRNADGADIYVAAVKLENGNAVDALTLNGRELKLEPIRIEQTYGKFGKGFYLIYEVPVKADTTLGVKYKPFDYTMELRGINPSGDGVLAEYTPMTAAVDSIENRPGWAAYAPLLPGIAAVHMMFEVKTEGLLYAQGETNPGNPDASVIRVYAGGASSVGDASKLLGEAALKMDGWQKTGSEYIRLSIPYGGDADNDAYTVTYNRNGQLLRAVTFTADTVLFNPEGLELYNHYIETYGDDRFGQRVFTDAERESDAFKLYASYSKQRFYMRDKLVNALKAIAAAPEDERAELLEKSKRELERASRGIGASVVMTNTVGYSLALVPQGATVAKAMCSALEAAYPANWSFVNAGGMVGGFGKGGVGAVVGGSGMAGFLYYNGVYANVGAFGAVTSDGDICTWGGQNAANVNEADELKSHYQQMKIWDIAVLHDVFGSEAALKDECIARGATRDELIGKFDAEMIERLFPEVDFTRFGRMGRELNAFEQAKKMVYAIGPLTAAKGAAIEAAREALDTSHAALFTPGDNNSQITVNLLKMREHGPYLETIETQYRILTAPAPADIREKANKVLSGYSGKISAKNSNIDTVQGMLTLITKAYADEVPNAEDVTRELIAQLNNTLIRYPETIDKNFASRGSAYFSVMTLSLGAGGYNAANFIDSNGGTHDFTAYLKDYDSVTAEGTEAVALALLALDSKPYDVQNTAIRARYAAWLAANQTASGAWLGDGVWLGNGIRGMRLPCADATALALAALSNYRTDASAEAAVVRGVSGLRGFQNEYGGMLNRYGSYDTMTTTLTVIALGALGIDQDTWKTARGNSLMSAILNAWNEIDNLFLMKYTEADEYGAQPFSALLAYGRTKQNKGSIFDLRDVFGEVYKVPVAAETDGYKAYAEIGTEFIGAVIAAAAADGAKTIRFQIAIPGDGRRLEEDEYEAEYAGWAAVNDEDLDPETVRVIPCNTVTLNLFAGAMNALRLAHMNLISETDVGTVSLDEGFVTEIAKATKVQATFTADASVREYYEITAAADGAVWKSSREADVKIPVPMPDPATVIALVLDDGTEQVFWKTAVVRNALSVKVKLPATLRVYRPSVVYGDIAEDSRFAAAAKFAKVRNLFLEEDGMFREDDPVTLAVLLRALYILEDSPEMDVRVFPNWYEGGNGGWVWYYDWNHELPKVRYNLGTETVLEDQFTIYGIEEDAWFRDYLIWGADNGIGLGGQTIGYPNKAEDLGIVARSMVGRYNFNAETALTRFQVLSVLRGYAVYLGLDVSRKADITNFTDYYARNTAEWYKEAWSTDLLGWAVYEGLLAADAEGKLRPGSRMTKGDLAQSLQSMVINISGGLRGQDENGYTQTIILGQRNRGDPAPEARPGTGGGWSSSPYATPNAPRQPLPDENQPEPQDNLTVPETAPPTPPPDEPPEPEDSLKVDTDVTQVTRDNKLTTAIIIGASFVTATGAAATIVSARRRRAAKR